MHNFKFHLSHVTFHLHFSMLNNFYSYNFSSYTTIWSVNIQSLKKIHVIIKIKTVPYKYTSL